MKKQFDIKITFEENEQTVGVINLSIQPGKTSATDIEIRLKQLKGNKLAANLARTLYSIIIQRVNGIENREPQREARA